MAFSKVIVTTTSSMIGWDIDNYCGPVTAHIVAGTGFFSDFAASFTDVFGGRSQTYQKQLDAIDREVIELLKSKAAVLGANIILNLRIDHDEISGKAKQMFMVTAYGMAVQGQQQEGLKKSHEKSSLLSSDSINIALKRQDIIEKANIIPIQMSNEEWDFAIENQIHEIAAQVLQSMEYFKKTQQLLTQEYHDRCHKYLLSIPAEYSIPVLYKTIKETESLRRFATDIIREGDLLDYDSIDNLLTTDDLIVKKWALALAQYNKPYYSDEDIERIEKLIKMIECTFQARVTYIEEKSMLSSLLKPKWVCECGKKNENDRDRCVNCERDIYGFKPTEPTPQGLIGLLNRKVEIIKKNKMIVD